MRALSWLNWAQIGAVAAAMGAAGLSAPVVRAGGQAETMVEEPIVWRALEGPRFCVLSQLSEEATRAWAAEFAGFVHAARGVVTVDDSLLTQLTVVLFAHDAQYDEYKPADESGRRAHNVAGYFASRPTWSVIGLANRGAAIETRQTVFHEGVHWLVSADPRTYPVWFEEGLADLLSTFRVENGEAIWGEPPAAYREYLRAGESLGIATLLEAQPGDALFAEETRAAAFYVRAWALMHWCTFARGDGARAALAQFEAARGSGRALDAAVRAAFGHGAGELESTLAEYIAAPDLPHLRRGPVSAPQLSAPVTEAEPQAVELALAELAWGANRVELATAHLQRSIEAAPHEVRAFERIAEFASEMGDDETARDAAQRALALGSRNASVVLALAQQEFRAACARGELEAGEARRIAERYAEALRLRPNLPAAYENLARLASMAPPAAHEARLLEQGRRLYPRNGDIVLGLAMLEAGRGRAAQAGELLREAQRAGAVFSAEAGPAAAAMLELLDAAGMGEAAANASELAASSDADDAQR